MGARADSAAATRARILEAATQAMRVRFRSDVRLDSIASAADVSVQTILRIFGSRGALLDAVAEAAVRDVSEEFADVVPGDVPAVVRAYYRHYERVGDLVVRNIADEGEPDVHGFVQRGRAAHRQGVQKLFEPFLTGLSDGRRKQTVDALICALDVYTWKLLRRDIGRSLAQAEATVRLMLQGIVEVQ